jgi:hypothetical protein
LIARSPGDIIPRRHAWNGRLTQRRLPARESYRTSAPHFATPRLLRAFRYLPIARLCVLDQLVFSGV